MECREEWLSVGEGWWVDGEAGGVRIGDVGPWGPPPWV